MRPEARDPRLVAAQRKMDACVSMAASYLLDAQKIADEFKLSFDFRPSYGMGGTYQGTDGNDAEEGWQPSSLSC